jgi:hypothetical protein
MHRCLAFKALEQVEERRIDLKSEDVPQDKAILGQWHGICYALNQDGRYVLTPSAGWEPANVANLQAWEVIAEDVGRALQAVWAGEASPLAFHMARCQMDVGLLAGYAQIPRWRVKRHLRPEVYARLKPALLERYARVFEVTVETLDSLPEKPELPVVLDDDKD